MNRSLSCPQIPSTDSSPYATGWIVSRCDFDLPGYEREITDLETQSGDPSIWNDPAAAQALMRRLGELKQRVGRWQAIEQSSDDLSELVELAADDAEMASQIGDETRELGELIDDLELELSLTGPYDASDAIMVVHSGEGGVDAQDWASMLVRMYLRWSDRHGFKGQLLDETEGDEAGIKNATIELTGANAYGLAKSEAGSHRLVRLSPFDSAHRRHTAFALVEVIPQGTESDHTIEIRPEDVRVDTYRASGAGGQHVNKTESAIRLTHLPTGLVVTCQNERSQMQNRETAFKILRARLLERKLQEDADEISRIKGDHTAAGFGNRIRSYVLHPYTQVTDHRTDLSVGDTQGVLDGKIDPFINAFMQQQMGMETPE
jgi:peptide chain release factor 2